MCFAIEALLLKTPRILMSIARYNRDSRLYVLEIMNCELIIFWHPLISCQCCFIFICINGIFKSSSALQSYCKYDTRPLAGCVKTELYTIQRQYEWKRGQTVIMSYSVHRLYKSMWYHCISALRSQTTRNASTCLKVSGVNSFLAFLLLVFFFFFYLCNVRRHQP